MKHTLLGAGLTIVLASSACAQDVPPPGYDNSTTTIDGVPGQRATEAQAPDGAPQYGAAPAMTPQMRHDIAVGMTYRLPPDFLPRATHTIEALRASGIEPPNSTGLSLDQTIARIQTLPGAMAVLHQDGFDARSFVLGMTAFGMTLASGDGEAPPPGMPQPDAGNATMFREHPQDVQALVQALGSPPGGAAQEPPAP